MPRHLVLTHTHGTLTQRIDLGVATPGRTFIVGRSIDGDVVLEDPRVSRRHLEIRVGEHGLEVRDLGSHTGTTVDGRTIDTWCTVDTETTLHVATHELRLAFRDSNTIDSATSTDTLVTEPSLTATLTDQPGARIGSSTREAVRVPLEHAKAVTLGRDPTVTITLAHPTISRSHTEIERLGDRCLVRDLGSTNGTFLNGARVRESSTLHPGDRLRIGPYTLHFTGDALVSETPRRGTRIEVRSLGKQVEDRATGRPTWLLHDIDLVIEPCEFVALLGSSGCGKTTFMDAVNGRRPATTGHVLYDETNLYDEFDALKRGIAYVPQDLIFHPHLPVDRALYYACRLRLPEDTTAHEIEQNIDRVLETVSLQDRKHTVIAHLSGGQKKRVAIAMELLSKPSVLFLDEATSGLDAGTEAQMMQLFRALADSGVTTLCITHFVDSLEHCDRVAYFVAGRLAYFGEPAGLRDAFDVDDVRDVYVRERERTPEAWERAFRDSARYETHVSQRLDQSRTPHVTSRAPTEGPRSRPSRRRTQFQVLTRRYVHVLSRDRRNVALLLLLAPLIAGLVALALPSDAHETVLDEAARQGQLAFIMTLVMFFLGIFGSIREIVKELSIYRHERFVNLEILPYLASKLLPLAFLGAIQTAEILLALHLLTDVSGDFLLQFLFLWGTCLAAMTLGLAISAAVNTADKAVLTMVVAIIPQLLFADAFIELRGAGETVGQVAVTSYWCYDGLENLLPEMLREAREPLRGALVLRGQGSAIIDASVIATHALVFAIAAAWFLRRKDRQVVPARNHAR